MNQNLGYLIYRIASKLRREKTFSLLTDYKSRQRWSAEKVRAKSNEDKNNLLRFLAAEVPFYIATHPSCFEDLPVISRETLQKEESRLTSKRERKHATTKTTGGSTGAPVTVMKDVAAMSAEQAATLRSYEWAAVHPGDRQARFWGVKPSRWIQLKDRIKDIALNRRRLSAFRLTESEMARFSSELRSFRPDYFYGYVSVIKEFARFHQTSTEKPFPTLRSIITTSEVLYPEDRAFISEVFRVPLYNEYGCGEVGTIAHECEAGSLHTNSENLFIEVLNESGTPVLDQEGDIIVTELHNRLQPIVRYRIGDRGALSSKLCSCGRGLPVLENISGRAGDFIIGVNGARYHPMFFFYIFENLKKLGDIVRQFQIVQKGEAITAFVVAGEDFKEEHRQSLVLSLTGEFPSPFSIEVQTVASVPREASGKLRTVKRIEA